MPEIIIMGWDATNKIPVRCKVTEDGKLIINPTGFLENPPTEDEDKKAPTSEWAFDHNADTVKHHIKYTDANARAAINDIFDVNGILIDTLECNYNYLVNARMVRMKNTVGDTHRTEFVVSTNGRKLRVRCYKEGVGYVPAIFEIFDGAAYHDAITEGNFASWFATRIQQIPVEDDTGYVPSSAWAYDHWKDVAAHHAKYTNKESVDAFKSRATTLTNGTYDDHDITDESMVYLDSSSGDIVLRGLAGGYDGKIVFFLRQEVGNQVIIRHAHATPAVADRIVLPSGSDQTMSIAQYGGFILIYYASRWRMMMSTP